LRLPAVWPSVDHEIAQDEWDNRFNLMHGKRLGPSVAPAEVVVPLSGLARTLEGIEERVGSVRLQEAIDAGAEALVAACPCCEVQFRVTADKAKQTIHIIDLAHLTCRGAGIDHPDSTPYALEMWAVFEAMIRLLKPEAMADLMADLLPEMIDAMPGPFPAMMKMVKGAPGPVRDAMIAIMKPMMPALFPALMPGMMPKVMPDMLAAVDSRIDMPKHMQEQMPDLMPAAMENLLPKMLPEVIPHFMPKMMSYLKGEPANGR